MNQGTQEYGLTIKQGKKSHDTVPFIVGKGGTNKTCYAVLITGS
jgi:hypothetical protein